MFDTESSVMKRRRREIRHRADNSFTLVASLASLRLQHRGESGSRINAHRLERRMRVDGKERSRCRPTVHCRIGPPTTHRLAVSVLDRVSKELECNGYPKMPEIGALVSRPIRESLLG